MIADIMKKLFSKEDVSIAFVVCTRMAKIYDKLLKSDSKSDNGFDKNWYKEQKDIFSQASGSLQEVHDFMNKEGED